LDLFRHFVLIIAVAITACLVRAQKIEVAPPQVMTDQTASVLVTGEAPGSSVTIHAELTDGGGQQWTSEAEFVADAQGAVNTAMQAPVKGSYRIVSSSGLVWSMRPTAKDVHVYEPPHNLGSQLIQFHLLQDGKDISSAQLEQLAIGPDVQRIRVDGALHGVFFVPDEAGRHPGILVLGGSEGGMPLRRAAWLASHGYAAFALCYFRCEGTPQQLENIPLEYFAQALSWMTQRPEVAADRLAVMGTSRGGELALQLGSMYPEIKAVVAYVPANVRYPACCQQQGGAAWTWQGRPLAWAPRRPNASPELAWDAQIAVEHTKGSILMIGAKDDGVWPSAEMVDAAASRLRSSHFAYQVVALKYDHAGHRVGLPEIIPAWSNGVVHPVSGRPIDFGGTPEGNAESSLDAIPKVLDFLRGSLLEPAPAKSKQALP
jgi:dienelactone hydrolase